MSTEREQERAGVDGRELDPRDDAEFLREQAERFHEFADDAARGNYSFDLVGELAKIERRVERIRPLAEIRGVVRLCMELIPPIVPDGAIQEDQLFAHWQLSHLDGEIDPDALDKDRARVTARKIGTRTRVLVTAQERMATVLQQVEATPLTDEYAVTGRNEAAKAVETFQVARRSLLTLIGARGEEFDPGQDYVAHFRRKRAELALSLGRSAEADGERIRAARKAKSWTQSKLASRARGRSKNNTLSSKTVHRMEEGKRIDIATLQAVADTLGLEILDIVR